MAAKKSQKDKPIPARAQRQKGVNKANYEKLTKMGGIAGKLGVERAYPKGPKESELSYIKRGLPNIKKIGKNLSKIQRKNNG